MAAPPYLLRAFLAVVALCAGVALAVPPPPVPLPTATSTVISQAHLAPAPTPMRRSPDPNPVPLSIEIPVITGFSIKLPIPKVSLSHVHTRYVQDTVTVTGIPFGMRPGHGLGGIRGHDHDHDHDHDRHHGHEGHHDESHAHHGGWDSPNRASTGFAGGGLNPAGLQVHGMPDYGLHQPVPHLRPEDLARERAGDLPLPPLPIVPGRAGGPIADSQYGWHGHGHGLGRGRGVHRRDFASLDELDDAFDDEWEWYERPYGRPQTDAYDDFDDDDDLDMGPPPPWSCPEPAWTEPTPVVRETANVTRTGSSKADTSFTHSVSVTGTGTKTLKKIWDAVKAGKALGILGKSGKGKRDE